MSMDLMLCTWRQHGCLILYSIQVLLLCVCKKCHLKTVRKPPSEKCSETWWPRHPRSLQMSEKQQECDRWAVRFRWTTPSLTSLHFKLVLFVSSGLDLRYNNITDEGVGHLAELLQVKIPGFSWMVRFSWNCYISNSCFLCRHISYQLFACCILCFFFTGQEESLALRSLDLMLNDFQINGAEVLAKSLEVYINFLHTHKKGILSAYFHF